MLGISEFETTPVYRVSSSKARATQRPCLELLVGSPTKIVIGEAWWSTPVILALYGLRQEDDCEFEDRQSGINGEL